MSIQSNTAKWYGTNYASFSREIKEIREDEFTYYVDENNDLSKITESAEGESLSRLDFWGVMSGGFIPTTYLALVD